MSGVEPLWTSKVGHTVLATLMESQIWHQPTGSVRGGFSKGTMTSGHPDARHFSLSLYTTLVHSCHCGAEAQREPICIREFMSGFPKRNCLGLQQSPLSTQSPLVFTARSCGTYLPSTGTLGWEPGVGLGLLTPKIFLSNFYPHEYGASPFHVHACPSSVDGCGFFNSVVVRLPFNSISDVPE